ncbi:ABC transporter permease [Falsochrobactrum sp. TDYN1]|uniref:ABC transporter permease n=1 Tax=Falsochrobactrum tianjinense TaxID=2706015 RepID=A0A949PMP7_9HYPH|nr:ABC transporter permease [Falsochrobactrum sp. TDYN1]MBV2143477.1 ABC transporter permease [Falsochrobactrum sp. TDYN1]
MELSFMAQIMGQLLYGLPLTVQLALTALALGGVLALVFVLMQLSGSWLLASTAKLIVFMFRGTPLLIQLFIIYYGLGQIELIRQSFAWPFFREPYWCALLALTLNSAAYTSEVMRGGFMSVPTGLVEAGKAYGMSPVLLLRRIILPIAIRQALPAYSSEVVSLVKATSLASIITLMEVTGIAQKLMSQTYRATEIFICAGLIYLVINFILTRFVLLLEYWLSPHLRPAPSALSPRFQDDRAKFQHPSTREKEGYV